jgi:hypothetical protein
LQGVAVVFEQRVVLEVSMLELVGRDVVGVLEGCIFMSTGTVWIDMWMIHGFGVRMIKEISTAMRGEQRALWPCSGNLPRERYNAKE